MNKKKFNKKSQEMADYEDKVLKFAKNYLSQYVLPLGQKNLCLDILLVWVNYKHMGSEESISRLNFKDGYICFLFLQVRRKNDPFPDFDLKSIWKPAKVTAIYSGIFSWQIFGITPIKKIEKQLHRMETTINEVLLNGYEKVWNKIYK